MKSILLLVLTSVMLLGLSRPRVDFSGEWRLDLKKSTHVPPSYATLRSYALRVRQMQDSIQFAVFEILRSGQEVTTKPTSCRLDGKERMIRDSLPGLNIWIAAKWTNSGKALLL